jgi:hypothetical protein
MRWYEEDSNLNGTSEENRTSGLYLLSNFDKDKKGLLYSIVKEWNERCNSDKKEFDYCNSSDEVFVEDEAFDCHGRRLYSYVALVAKNRKDKSIFWRFYEQKVS